MKVNFGIYDINISAKYYWQDKGSKEVTLACLSYLSSALHEAAQWNREHGYNSTGDRLEKEGNALYQICKDAGLYKNYEQQ